jgi:uncharacterized protein YoxC
VDLFNAFENSITRTLDTAEAKLDEAVTSAEKLVQQSEGIVRQADIAAHKTDTVIATVEQKLAPKSNGAVVSDADS